MSRQLRRHQPKPKLPAQRWFRSRRFTIVIILAIVGVSISLAKEIIRKVQVQQQIASLETEINSLEQRNSELNDLMAYFNSSSFQDKQARQKLSLKEPGETEVVIPQVDTSYHSGSDSNTASPSAAAPERPNWQRWADYFFE